MKTLDQKKEVERITNKLFDLNSWIDGSFPEEKRKDFFKKINLKEETFWKQLKEKKLKVSTIYKTIELLNIPFQIASPIFFEEKPSQEIKNQLKELVEKSFEKERKN